MHWALVLNLVIIFFLGAAVGSFLNVCIARLPLQKSVFWPGSRCWSCLQPIRWYDDIPLVSYWVLRGRCRSCKVAFSIRYFLVELITGVGFVALFCLEAVINVHHLQALEEKRFYINFGVIPFQAWIVFSFHALLFSFLLVATFTDLDDREIPASLPFCGALIGVIGSVLFPWPWPDQP